MKTSKLAALIAALLMAAPVAKAVDFDWTGASGVDNNWLTPGNWSVGGVPSATPPTGGAGNFARFLAPMPAPAIINADTLDVQDFLTGNNGVAGIRQIDHVAGTASFNSGWFRMGGLGGVGDVGTYNLSGGQVISSSYRIGEGSGQIATVNVSGGAMRQSDVADIANGDGWSKIGTNATTNINLSGTGLMSFDSRLLIGVGDSTGVTTINQTGGAFEVRRGEFTLGDSFNAMAPAPNANYNISGGTLNARGTIDNDDTGGNITIGQWDNSNAKLAISGSAVVRADRDVNIADGRVEVANRGEIAQSGGTFTYGRNFEMARTPSGNATYNLSGGQLRQDDGDQENQANWNHLGQAGVATFNIADGLASFNARTMMATGAGSNSTVNQTGGVFQVRNHELVIGDSGTATYNISGGTLQTAGNVAVGNWDNSTGVMFVDGTATVLVGDRLLIGQNNGPASSGQVSQVGGTIIVNNSLDLAVSASATGIFNLVGGTLDLTNGNVNFGPGTAAFNFADGVLRGVANFNRALAQAGGIFEVGGVVGAGGVTTINGDFTGDGILRLELAPGSIGDALAVNGLVSISGGLDLVPGALLVGDTYVILQNDGVDPIGGGFAGLADGQSFAEDGYSFRIHYNGGDGNDIAVEVVPEPATALALIGGFGILAMRRRRNS